MQQLVAVRDYSRLKDMAEASAVAGQVLNTLSAFSDTDGCTRQRLLDPRLSHQPSNGLTKYQWSPLAFRVTLPFTARVLAQACTPSALGATCHP